MAFTVTTLSRSSENTAVYYDPEFRTVLESHMQLFRTHPSTQASPIGPDKIHQYEGDFYGLLGELGILMEHRWLYMRVNGMMNPNEFGRDLQNPYADRIGFRLLTPPMDLFGDIRMLFLTTRTA